MVQKVIATLIVSAFFTSVRSCAPNGTDSAEICATSLGDETSLVQKKMTVKTNLHKFDEKKAAEKIMSERDSNTLNFVGDQGFAEGNQCPTVDWDQSAISENQAILEMINDCLEEVDVKVLTVEEAATLDKATKRIVNSFDQTTCEPPEVCPDMKKNRRQGGICGAKIFKAKCENQIAFSLPGIPDECKKHALFRVFSKSDNDNYDNLCYEGTDGRRSTKCQSGSYWTASSPAGVMSREEYRQAYAICDKWNPELNMIAKWTFHDDACKPGQYVFIGNGEAAENCGSVDGVEKYGFSKYLQVAITYPARDILSKESVKDWVIDLGLKNLFKDSE